MPSFGGGVLVLPNLGSSPPSRHGHRVAYHLAAPHAKLAVRNRHLHRNMRPLHTPRPLVLLLPLMTLLLLLLVVRRHQVGLDLATVPEPRRAMVDASVTAAVGVPTSVAVTVHVRAHVPRVPPADTANSVRAGPDGDDRDAVAVLLGDSAGVQLLSALKVRVVIHGARRQGVMVVLLVGATEYF